METNNEQIIKIIMKRANLMLENEKIKENYKHLKTKKT